MVMGSRLVNIIACVKGMFDAVKLVPTLPARSVKINGRHRECSVAFFENKADDLESKMWELMRGSR